MHIIKYVIYSYKTHRSNFLGFTRFSICLVLFIRLSHLLITHWEEGHQKLKNESTKQYERQRILIILYRKR